jgi:competence protein ComEC
LTLTALVFSAATLALALRAPAAGFHQRPSFGAWGACFLIGATLLAWTWHITRVPPPPAAWATLPPREATLTVRILRTFNAKPGETTVSGLAQVVAAPDILPDLIGVDLQYSVRARPAEPAPTNPTRSRRANPTGPRPADPIPERGATVQIDGVLSYLPDTPAPPPAQSSQSPAASSIPAQSSPASFNTYLHQEGIWFSLARGRVVAIVAPPSWWQRWTSAQNTHLENILRRGPAALEQSYGNVYTGLFLGKSTSLDDPQRTAFTLMGVMYLFAISGLHVGIVAGALLLCLRRIPRLPRTAADVAALALAWLYVEITGGSPSARRAALMLTFYLFAIWLGRPRGSLGAILAAGLVTLVIEPLALLSPGFQLSYSVVFGLILYAPPLRRVLQARLTPWRDLPVASRAPWQKCTLWTWDKILACVTLSWTAFLCSSPLAAEYFQVVSLGGLLTNLILIPLISLAMGAAVVAIAFGLLTFPPFTWLTWIINAFGLTCAGLMQKLVESTAPIPGLHAHLFLQPAWIGQAAALAVLVVILAARPRARPPRWWYYLLPVIILVAFAAFTVHPA